MTLSECASTSLFTAVALFCNIATTSAQTPVVPPPAAIAPRLAWHWEQLGPMPGAAPEMWEMETSAADPDRIYASSRAGVLASFDRGLTWELRSRNTGYAGFADLSVSPADANTLLRANIQGPLERSSDGGLTWQAATTPPVGDRIRSPKFTLSNTVYVSSFYGIWKSVDGGDNFVEVLSDLQGGFCLYLRVDANDALHAYAPVNGVGLFETTDGGASWNLKPLPISNLLSLAVDPLDGNRLLLGRNGVYFSSDGGSTWADISSSISDYVDALAFDPVNPQRFYAGTRNLGIVVTNDGGLNWNISTDPGLDTAGTQARAILPSLTHPGQLVVGAVGGVFRSTDSGATFARVNNGLSTLATVNALVVDPFDSNHLVAFTGGEAFYSQDEGASWTESSGIRNVRSFDMKFDSVIPGRIYLGNWILGFWRSDDGGHSFYESYPGPRYFVEIAAHPTIGGRVFGTGQGLQRSDDGGVTFSPTSAPLGWSWSMAISHANPDTIYVSGITQLLHSTDGGLTWQDATTKPAGIVRELFADPLDPNRAYAAVPFEGIYRTDDHGVNWTLMSPLFLSSDTMTVPAFNSGMLLGNVQVGHSSLISTNGGLSGFRVRTGLETTLADFANGPLKTFAGTGGQGVVVLGH